LREQVDGREADRAYLVGLSAASENGDTTFVIAGRVGRAQTTTIRFRDPGGALVERPIGMNGFFVAALHGKPPIPVATPDGVKCPVKSWNPTFVALGSDGRTVQEATVPLMESRLCVTGFRGP
jgi:hypothetical protein